jgi:hypothetical protein
LFRVGTVEIISPHCALGEVAMNLTRLEARTIIESLRDGVVPRHGAEFFTAGREKWLEKIREDLEDLSDPRCTKGRLRIVNGRNGDGKTHLMHLIADMALKSNFAVSYVVIGPDTPLFRSDKVYAAIGRSLSTLSNPDGAGLRAVLDPDRPDPAIAKSFRDKAATIRAIRSIDPSFAQAAYRFCTQQTANVDQTQDLLLLGAWLEGSQAHLKELGISATVDASNGTRMLRSLVLLLRHFGFKGLVVLVDEVESVLNLSKNKRRDSFQTLRLIIDRESTPEHVLISASTTPPMFTDRDRGMQTYPALWSRVQPIYETSEFVNYRATLIDLSRSPLSPDEYNLVGSAIRAIHSIAYEWDASRVSDKFISAAAQVAAAGRLTLVFSTTRVFVKSIVETLELANQHPELDVSAQDIVTLFSKIDRSLSEAEAQRNVGLEQTE